MNYPDKNKEAANPKYINSVLITLALILGLSLGFLGATGVNSLRNIGNPNVSVDQSSSNLDYDQKYINNILNVLEKQYIGGMPSDKDLTLGMVKGIVTSLNDPYTSFLTPEEAKQYTESRNPDFEGIGVTMSFKNENTYIESVLSGLPADKSGILSGDIVIEVDGVSVEGETPSLVASKVGGKKGTEVKLKIYRESISEFKDFAIIRDKIDISNISYKSLENGIVKIDITQFIDTTAEEFNKEWDRIANEVKALNPKGIIVDLRNNPGGYVYSVNYVLEDFLTQNQIVLQEESKTQGKVVYRDGRLGRFENIPVNVIVNEGSASASEIFAAAIQENSRGKVIGKPTVGKGVEQTLIDNLSDNSLLILVFQKWLTPNGNNISKENPIKPDFEVDYSAEDFKAGKDTQLNKSIEMLGK